MQGYLKGQHVAEVTTDGLHSQQTLPNLESQLLAVAEVFLACVRVAQGTLFRDPSSA